MSFSFTVLHISDLHERGPREGEPWRRRRVLGEAWLRNLDELRKDGPVDLICFTGDLAERGQPAEYAGATEFLDATLQCLGLARDRLFPVPGNHDINRNQSPEAEAAWRSLRENLYQVDPLEVSRWLRGGQAPFGFQDPWRDAMLSRQEAYERWLASFGRAELLPARSRHNRLGYRASLRLPGCPFDLHIVGLDSSWLCGDDSDSGKLRLTEDQVMRLCTDERGEKLGGFRLALVHHPLTQLTDGAACRRLLAEHVDLLLRGHLHETEPELWSDPGRSLRQIAAGCLYEGHRADQHANACILVRVRCDELGRPQRFELRFRGWTTRGFWFDDGSLYREASTGRLLISMAEQGEISPARPTGVFIGRAAELQELERLMLSASGPSRPVAVCALQGMPGVGKSYLCDHFAQQHADEFPGGYHRIVFSLGVTPTPEEKLAELAESLGIRGPVAALWETMRHRLRAPRSLLHIENVDGATLADVAARLVRGLEGCAVLVSGRYQGLGRAAGWAEVSVKPLGPEDSLAQLIAEHRAPSTAAEEQEFRSLVHRLDGLPLAIHLCAGQLRRRLSVKRFLERLDRTVLDLEAPPGDPRAETRERTVLRASFALSMEQLKDQLGIDGEPLTRALAGLGHAAPSGVGLNLAASLCGLPMDDCERLLIGAVELSLLEPEFDENRPDGVWRIHPLLAEFLRQSPQPEGGGFVGMTQWFLSRLPRPGGAQAEQQGKCWNEINAERGSLVSWLEHVQPEQIATVERAGSWFAMLCGPFAAWAALCERGLAGTTDDGTRSNLLWTLSRVLLTSGELDRAHARSLEKAQIDTRRNARHEAALAQGTVAEILHERGQPDEALRICREECLPVYQELGDIGEQAVTMGLIADILRECGQQDEALRILEKECKPAFEKRGDTLSLALTMGKIAHIYQMRGQMDQALHILEKECKPAFEKLGDIRSRSVTMSHIADILFARGQLDEALRIRREEQLPVYEKLGEVRSWAATMGQIADILQARGQLDEALHTRREECLPVYQKLGDILSRAVTMGKIADIYRARGQLDDAMQIHCEEELPVYEKLGNIRERAVAMGKIADILNMRGNPDEALRIRREEQLPVFEKLGDIRSWAATMGKIADIHAARGQLDEALRILQEECKPAFEKLGDIRSRAATMGNIADILKVRGQLDDAIRLHRQEELPVYEKLEARHELLVGRTKLAVALRQRGAHDDKQEARSLLLLALHDAQELRLPEAAKIERLLARDVDEAPV